ncbi:MAG: hypothetical protein ACKN9U_04960, partial [Pirellulaceae bacterium]
MELEIPRLLVRRCVGLWGVQVELQAGVRSAMGDSISPAAIAALVGAAIFFLALMAFLAIFANFFWLWIQSVLTDAGITIWDLIGMRFRKIDAR